MILDGVDFKLERIDLSHSTSEEERHSRAKEICRTDAAKPFDLARGPLIRGKVIQLAEQEHILLLNMHHIITDGWSMGVLIQELDVIMRHCARGAVPACHRWKFSTWIMQCGKEHGWKRAEY